MKNGSPEHYAELRRQRAENYEPGPMGLPIGATAAEIPPKMAAEWGAYWDDYRHNSIDDIGTSGGKLVRIGPNQAVFTRPGKDAIFIMRESNLNALALQDETIAAEWLETFGFKTVPLS